MQAYFYEGLTPCPSSAEPNFGADLTDLLLRINSAITYSENFDRLSSANLTIYIQVSDVTRDASSANLTIYIQVSDVMITTSAVPTSPSKSRSVTS